MKNLNRGFTLIELMVVVAIVAILASIALPAYNNAVLKGRRAEGRTALTDLMQQQERYMTQNNTYMAFTYAESVNNPAAVPFKTFSGDSPASSHYHLSAAVCAGLLISDCVMVSAQPVPDDGADPQAGTLQILSTGQKTCTGRNQSVCWN